MNVNVMVWKCWGVKQWSYNNELNTYACFPTGPTSTGHSVLIHRGGCRHVIGVKFIRVRVCVHVDTRTGKADGKDGRSGTACRSVYEIAGSLADVSAKRVAGKTSRYTLPLSTPLFAMIRTGKSLVTSPKNAEVVLPSTIKSFHTTLPLRTLDLANIPLVHLKVRPEDSQSIYVSSTTKTQSQKWVLGAYNDKDKCERLQESNAGGKLRIRSLFLRVSMASCRYTHCTSTTPPMQRLEFAFTEHLIL